MANYFRNARRILVIITVCLGILPLFISAAYANGQLVIPQPPMPYPQFQPLILEKQEIKTTIDGQVAKTHIKQVWRNNNGMALEGEFLFPLPSDRATMSDFVLWMDGKKLTFETMDASKARGIYENIVRQMRDPGLLEYAGDGLLKCRIYPVPANGTKEIELEYREIIIKTGNLARYAFPLGIKGLPQPVGNLLIDITITSPDAMGKIYSPTHDVSVDMKTSNNAHVTMEKSNYMPTREFVLFMSHPQNEFGVDLITYKPDGEDGYFLGLISPRFDFDASNKKPIAKDFMFVLDTSGSMEGQKIVQAKDALKYILRNLNTDDRFALISFSSEVRKYKDGMAGISDVSKAINYVDTLSAVGGTYIDGALKDALSFVGSTDKRPFYIVFLTDGLPTIGEQNIDTILANVKKTNERDGRIFTFGVGDDVNIPFIDKLASENGGDYANASPDEDIEVSLSNLYQKIKSPVLTDLQFEVGGVTVSDVYPKTLPDLFKGGQLVVTGRYKGTGKASVTLKGKLGGSNNQSFNYSMDFKSSDDNTFIPPLWANRKVGYLLNQTRLYGENKETTEQIIALAKKYGIITPYTSYLVLEDGMVPPGAVPMGEFLMRDGFGGGVAKNPAAPAFVQGGHAREASKSMQRQEQAGSLEEAEDKDSEWSQQMVQQVKNKTFVQKGVVWEDTEYDSEAKLKEVQIKFMSDEYFALIDKYPDIGQYLAVGDNVRIVWDNQVFVVQSE
jgi:Ca-activated chloride channel family protein